MSGDAMAPELTPNQYRALTLLLAGKSAARAAYDCGICERTVRDWLRQPEFHAALAEARAQLLNAVRIELAASATVAIRTLTEVCNNHSAGSAVRASAAGRILNFLFRGAPQVLEAAQLSRPAGNPVAVIQASEAPEPLASSRARSRPTTTDLPTAALSSPDKSAPTLPIGGSPTRALIEAAPAASGEETGGSAAPFNLQPSTFNISRRRSRLGSLADIGPELNYRFPETASRGALSLDVPSALAPPPVTSGR